MTSSGAAAPVFLIGFQRSGTTLLRLLLDSHSALAIPFESMSVIDFYHRQGRYGDLSVSSNRAALVDDLLAAKGISAWEPPVRRDDVDLGRCTSYAATIDQIFSAYARRCGKPRWGDKTPGYTRDVHILNEMFPDSKFVHLVRDGRDAALSVVRQPWGPGDFLSALRQWKEVVGWSRKMCRMLPADRYLEIRFEDLSTEPERVLRQVTAFLNVDFEPAMLERKGGVEGRIPERSKAFHANLDRPIDASFAFEWRRHLSPADQVLALRVAGTLLEELNYPVDLPDVSSLRVTGRDLWRKLTAAARWRIRRLRRLAMPKHA